MLLKIINKNKTKSVFYKNLIKQISFKKTDVPDGNYYEVLNVKYEADYETIKKTYYKLAKKYHPDLNDTPGSVEIFKKIKKAYEVLGDPNLRIAYDIENNFTDMTGGEARRESDSRYTSKYGTRVMRGPRSIKNFYWDKWSNFKTPKWSNLKSGMDYRAEYMFRDDKAATDMPYKSFKLYVILVKRRIVVIFLIIFGIDILFVMKNWGFYKAFKMYEKAFFLHGK